MTISRSWAAQVGRRIAAARKNSELTQGEAATRTGYHLQTWYRWEKGIQPPEAPALYALCKLLKVSADHILGLPK